jgi:hypothetical protein
MQTIEERGICVTDVLHSLSLMFYSDFDISAALCQKMPLVYDLSNPAVETPRCLTKLPSVYPITHCHIQENSIPLYSIV